MVIFLITKYFVNVLNLCYMLIKIHDIFINMYKLDDFTKIKYNYFVF